MTSRCKRRPKELPTLLPWSPRRVLLESAKPLLQVLSEDALGVKTWNMLLHAIYMVGRLS